jgi:hypothetical protein
VQQVAGGALSVASRHTPGGHAHAWRRCKQAVQVVARSVAACVAMLAPGSLPWEGLKGGTGGRRLPLPACTLAAAAAAAAIRGFLVGLSILLLLLPLATSCSGLGGPAAAAAAASTVSWPPVGLRR